MMLPVRCFCSSGRSRLPAAHRGSVAARCAPHDEARRRRIGSVEQRRLEAKAHRLRRARREVRRDARDALAIGFAVDGHHDVANSQTRTRGARIGDAGDDELVLDQARRAPIGTAPVNVRSAALPMLTWCRECAPRTRRWLSRTRRRSALAPPREARHETGRPSFRR